MIARKRKDAPTIAHTFLSLFVTAGVSAVAAPHSGVQKAGAGGYLLAPPRPCKPLPEIIYTSDSLKGAIPTGQWWSSLVWQPFSQPMFPHPLALRCLEGGMAVSYPGARITANEHGIFGEGIPPGGDFTIGHAPVSKFTRADCSGFSDWFVTAEFSRNGQSLQTRFGHGSPYVFGTIQGGNPWFQFPRPPKVWSGTAQDATLGITINGHHYGLFGPSGSTWGGLEDRTLTLHTGGKSYFSIAVLPDNQLQTLHLFHRHAHNHITDTHLRPVVENGVITSTYSFTIEAKEESSATGTLFALYPHQWKYTQDALTDLTYGSVRGTLKIGKGDQFRTVVPVQGVLPMLPAQGIANRTRMLRYLQTEANKKPRGYGDTYWEGKHLGKLATLSGIAEAVNALDMQRMFIGEIKRRLEAWFTATPGKDQPVFYYDAHWGTLVGSRPSYGSDRPLNDHHFHYGYFIRAAAEVARLDPAWARQWGPMVQLVIRDIASNNRQDTLFPYLRCFDKYAGHSWASGDANFGDGNNQESSSEAINAWYGMILWGEATGDRSIRDTGIHLFNTERIAVEEYWFDVSGTNYPEEFPQVALGMVWGGKGAFGTWFSGDIDCIHGINWLPFTPASLYMGRHPDYVKLNHDRIVAVRKGGTDYDNGWGDLVCMFNALQDPDTAAAFLDTHPDCKLEGGNTHAFMYHWIQTLKTFGQVDPETTADHPLAIVFNRDGQRTYVAYNGGAQLLLVTFSNGTRLEVEPRTLTVR